MNVPSSPHSRLAGFATSLILIAALTLASCQQPKPPPIDDSNRDILHAVFELPGAHPGSSGIPRAQIESDKIDAFIAAHPGEKATHAPLRIRQAMLLLSVHEFNRANAAFAQADSSDLHTPRDQALKRQQDTLVWWFANSGKGKWTPADMSQAQKSLRDLAKEQARLDSSEEIRDYIAEVRAWIGLSAARQTSDEEEARSLLEDALNVYATAFTDEDMSALGSGSGQSSGAESLTTAQRRRLRAKAVLNHAKQQNKEDQLSAHPKAAVFNAWIN